MRAKRFERRELALAWGVFTHNLWMLARLRKIKKKPTLGTGSKYALGFDKRPGIQVICQAAKLWADHLYVFPSAMLVRIVHLRLHLPQNKLSDADPRIHL